jgi:hypothetical protein
MYDLEMLIGYSTFFGMVSVMEVRNPGNGAPTSPSITRVRHAGMGDTISREGGSFSDVKTGGSGKPQASLDSGR